VGRDSFAGAERVGRKWVLAPYQKNIYLDVPMLVGVCILERSKAYMQRCFYELCDAFPKGAVKLLGTDTDSIYASVATADYFADLLKTTPEMIQWRRRLDLSSFAVGQKFPEGDARRSLAVHPDMAFFATLPEDDPRSFIACHGSTRMFPGLLKDEIMLMEDDAASYLLEFAGLRSKMYSYDDYQIGLLKFGDDKIKKQGAIV
jgi:hypothetical protein